MDHQSFNHAIFSLWERFFDEKADVYVPLILPPLVDGELLFIGNNPSFSVKGFRRFLTGTNFSHIDPQSFFHWRNRHQFDLETAIQIERLAKEKYAYFNKFKDISEDTGLKWEHIDLFFFRETKQDNFKRLILDGKNLKSFAIEQLSLSKKLLETINPMIIVVVNAFASDVFKKTFGSKFDEKLGYYKTIVNGRSVPTFLGSMLTGQRAMDRFSYQRLRWHIGITVRHMK